MQYLPTSWHCILHSVKYLSKIALKLGLADWNGVKFHLYYLQQQQSKEMLNVFSFCQKIRANFNYKPLIKINVL